MAASDTAKANVKAKISSEYPFLANYVSTVVPAYFVNEVSHRVRVDFAEWLLKEGHITARAAGSQDKYFNIERAVLFLLKEEGFEAEASSAYHLMISI